MLELSTKNRVGKAGSDTPTAFRWRLEGAPLPPLTAALRIGLATRAAVYDIAEKHGLMPLPTSFHRTDDARHTHAFWLPEDADADGLIDHVLLSVSAGIPWSLLPLMAKRLKLDLADLGRWQLLPRWMGNTDDLCGASSAFGPAQRWRSLTPYVTPLSRARPDGLNRDHTLSAEAQLRWEVGMRRLGARVTGITLSGELRRGQSAVPVQEFTRTGRRLRTIPKGLGRPGHWCPPQDATLHAVEVAFDRPMRGPLAFGFGAHFGLGQFEAQT